MGPGRVLLYVQHLLGVGHLKRCATLAEAMTRSDLEVTLVTGGFPVPGMAIHAARVVQLPPLGAADMSFKVLLDASGRPLDDAMKSRRRELLLETWREVRPHALVIELFPFGRRQMRFELLPLLEAASAASPRPVRACSVRDVLGGGQKDPARADQMLEMFERHFDHLLVHGDPELVPFDRTFRHAARIAGKLHYTGYVVDRLPASGDSGQAGADEVLVSVGGGAVGRPLLEAAIRARPLTVLRHHVWRILTGVNAGDADLAHLVALAGDDAGEGVLVERYRPDFAQRLANCRLSISQGGYNTIMETLHAGARAVVVPFAGGAETEQDLRAHLLAERGWIDVVQEQALDPVALAEAVNRAAARAPARARAVRLDGASTSAALVSEWIQGIER